MFERPLVTDVYVSWLYDDKNAFLGRLAVPGGSIRSVGRSEAGNQGCDGFIFWQYAVRFSITVIPVMRKALESSLL